MHIIFNLYLFSLQHNIFFYRNQNEKQEVNLPEVVDSLRKLAVAITPADQVQKRSLRKRRPTNLEDVNRR